MTTQERGRGLHVSVCMTQPSTVEELDDTTWLLYMFLLIPMQSAHLSERVCVPVVLRMSVRVYVCVSVGVCMCVRVPASVLPEQRNFLLLIWPMRLLARRRGLVQRAPLVSMGLSWR